MQDVRIPLDLLDKAKINLPWWLAGGISSEWVQEIFKRTIPFGLDASSRLESKPGVKDLEKVKALINAVKSKS